MILTRGIWARLAALGVFTALAQLSFFSEVHVIGASPDFALLVVMSLGLLGGSMTGAVAGFAIGLLIDCLMLQTMGVTALMLLTVGYLAGRYRENAGVPTRGAAVLLAGALTLLGALVFAFLQLMIGLEADVSPLVARDILVVTALGMILVTPVRAAVRRLLRPALIEDRPRTPRPVAPAPIEIGS